MAHLERITLKNKLNLRLPHSSLHDYSDEYIHVQRTKTITGTKGVGDAAWEKQKEKQTKETNV